jgi:hypothetical protein
MAKRLSKVHRVDKFKGLERAVLLVTVRADRLIEATGREQQ